MNDKIKIALISAATLIIVALIISSNLPGSTGENTVQVNGLSEIEVSPDLISVYFTIETKAATSQEAKDSNAIKTDSVVSALMGLGYEREEIQTSGFNIWEDRGGYGTPTPKANEKFIASHTLIVKLETDERDNVGSTIDAGVDAGATLNYINFELSQEKESEYKVLAIKRATEDAREKAEALADGLGKDLGKVVSVTNSDFQYYPWLAYEKSAMDSSSGAEIQTNIVPSDQVVSASVTVVYKLG